MKRKAFIVLFGAVLLLMATALTESIGRMRIPGWNASKAVCMNRNAKRIIYWRLLETA